MTLVEDSFFDRVPPRSGRDTEAAGAEPQAHTSTATGQTSSIRSPSRLVTRDTVSTQCITFACHGKRSLISKYSTNARGYGRSSNNSDRGGPSRSAEALREKLGVDNQGPLGSRYSRRLPARARCGSETVARATPPTVQPGTDSTIRTGSRGSVHERGSDRTIGFPRGRVSIHPLPSPKKGRRSKTGHQSQGAQRVRGSATLQDGGHTHTKKPPTTWRLASENRPEGCIFCRPNSPRQQETPEIPTREQDLRIHLPPLRSGFGTMGLYQDPQTSSSSRTRVRDACVSDSLHRQHPPNGENQGGITGPGRRSGLFVTVSGIHNKHRENHHKPNTVASLPGFYDRHDHDGTQSTTRVDQEDQGGV